MTYQRKPHQTAIGPLSARSANVKHFIAPRESFATPARITNAGIREPLNLAHEWRGCVIRAERLVAFSLPSLGIFKANSDRLIEAQESATAESAPADSAVVQL